MTAPRYASAALAAMLLGSLGAACSDEPVPPPPAGPRSAIDVGAELYRSRSLSSATFNAFTCATCHVTGPQPSGNAVLPGGPLGGVVERPSYWGGAEIDLLRAVNACLGSFMLQDEPWTGEEPEARALYAYLESLPAGDTGAAALPFDVARDVADIPNGDADRGGDVYARACESCHGTVHEGAGRIVEYVPVLPDDALAAHPLGEYTESERRLVFIEKIRHGLFLGYGGQMPPFSRERLTDADVGALLSLFLP